MHHIYHTEGIILSSQNFGEAGKYYSIFTRDLGMISASAQGIRKISSKLRFVLQDFTYIRIDLVKGKDFWRITNVLKTNKLGELFKPEILKVFVNISRLLKRLLTGEDSNEALFIDLLNGLSMLEKSKTKNELHNVEIIIVLRILNNLGYIGDDKILKDFVRSPFEKDLIFNVLKSKTKILNQINKALKETQL